MKKSLTCAALLIFIGCLTASRANAQQVYLFSQSSCEQDGVDCQSSVGVVNGTIWGYSSTEVDYWTRFDYSPEVEGWIYDQYGNMLDDQWDPDEYMIAQVYTSTPANPDMVYTEVGAHDVIAQYYYEDIEKSPEGCSPCDGCNTDCYYFYENWWWYDPFGFSFTNPGYYGPWWDVYGYGPYNEIENDEVIPLGETTDQVATACAVPTNFHQTRGEDGGSGVIRFEYQWSSNTGHLRDLSQCAVEEVVTYNSDDIPPPSPPWPAGYSPTNPTILPSPPVVGSVGAGNDIHATNGSFVTPYSTSTVRASQIYRYRCPCHNNGANETLYGPLDIVRSISQNQNGSWRYTITKNGVSSTVNPLP